MPPRSKILSMPKDLQEELNSRLVSEGFRNYEDLSEWLNDELEARGMELRVSHMAVHRHGEKFESKLEALRLATDQAKALAEGAQDDEGAMGDALVRLVQEKLFTLLMDMGEIDPKKVNISGLLKGIAQITRASVTQKKWMAEVRVELERKKSALAEEVSSITAEAGLSEEDAGIIKAKILGLELDG